ncbi:MAG TPA: glycosyltransferase family 39 protein [Candidatus Binataceae bacterium]|nr:glycosyltransferase family 39 protein [Candidatus Binataceae bacterium]
MRAPNLERAAAVAMLLLAASLFFFHLGSYGLWEPDEARYAEIPREMLATGDFVVPHLNYVIYVEKPPLLYWLTAFSFRLFGENEFAARIVPATSAMLGVIATYVFAILVFDRRRAILAGAILATSPLYAVMAQVLTTDMLLTALMTIAFFSFLLAWRDKPKWRWAFYAAMGLGILTKGPVGAVLPIMAAIIFLWWQGELAGGIKKLKPVSGLLVTMLIAAPWFVAISVRVPDFLKFYVVGEHLRRFFQASYSHGEPIYFYLPVLAAGLLPWSLLTPAIIKRGPTKPARSFCLIATIVVLVLFSLASAKLIPYILPALPPIAVLLADAILSIPERAQDSVSGRRPMLSLQFAGALVGLIGVVILALPAVAPHAGGRYLALAREATLAIGAILFAGGVLTTSLFRRGRIELALVALTITSASALLAGSYVRIAVEPMRSYAELSRAVAALEPDASLICYHRYIQALPFYARRRVILVGAPTELGFGAAHSAAARDYFFNSDADLMRLWNRPQKSVLLIDQSDLDRLKPLLGDFRVIAKENKKLAVVQTAP